jgi:transposase
VGPPSRKLRSNAGSASARSSRSLKLHRETGSVDPAKFGGYRDFTLAAHEDLVRQLVAEQPDITLAELEDRLRKKKITVGKSSISRFLHHLKLPF